MPDHHTKPRPVVFGEVLFDHFPDGRAALGGAPFNVAWHLRGFGLDPLLITRIGEDVPGEWVLAAMREWGMDTGGVQLDPYHTTGSVQVTLHGNEPIFRILGDQAYDYIAQDSALAHVVDSPTSVFYHGTLAARSPTSRDTLLRLRDAVAAPVFVDGNLRAPWWEAAVVEKLFTGAEWLKLNRDELRQFVDVSPPRAAAEVVFRRYRVARLLVTAGGEGAHQFADDQQWFAPVAEARPFANSVGAGDAFSAVCLLGFTSGWAPTETLRRANEFASFVCTLPGALCRDKALYQELHQRWLS